MDPKARILEISQRLSEDNLSSNEEDVREIIKNVRAKGDAALKEYTQKFDQVSPENFRIPISTYASNGDGPNYLGKLDPKLKQALMNAKYRIRLFHQRDKREDWSYQGPLGEKLGAKYTPIESVGIYVPGASASLLSTVLMTTVPAKVAGVKRVVLMSPPPISDEILAAAELAQVDEVYSVGGAQAIAALAYGTETIKPVDKIVGPGNIYVSLAKRAVFGHVGIDGIYGPSELAIVADASAKAENLAMDLLSQLEHASGLESVLLLTDSQELADKTKEEFTKALESLNKSPEEQAVIKNSFEKWSDVFVVANLEEAVDLVNLYSPEHLELQIPAEKAHGLMPRIKNAGAIFMGKHACESLGDYMAGPSHCLPTGATARFSSGLELADFMKKSSIIDFSEVDNSSQTFQNLAKDVALLARAEKLEAHAKSMELRTIVEEKSFRRDPRKRNKFQNKKHKQNPMEEKTAVTVAEDLELAVTEEEFTAIKEADAQKAKKKEALQAKIEAQVETESKNSAPSLELIASPVEEKIEKPAQEVKLAGEQESLF